jgi:hypothetical protein
MDLLGAKQVFANRLVRLETAGDDRLAERYVPCLAFSSPDRFSRQAIECGEACCRYDQVDCRHLMPHRYGDRISTTVAGPDGGPLKIALAPLSALEKDEMALKGLIFVTAAHCLKALNKRPAPTLASPAVVTCPGTGGGLLRHLAPATSLAAPARALSSQR